MKKEKQIIDPAKYLEGTPYDTALIKQGRKTFFKKIIPMSIYTLIIYALMIPLILYNEILPVFIATMVVGVILSVLLWREAKKIAFRDFRSARGNLEHTDKEIRNVSTTKVGGIDIFRARKYDTYRKDEIHLNVYIEEGNEIAVFTLPNVREKHAEYYDEGGEVVHIYGTRFPVKVEIGDYEWLCPVCGVFNSVGTKTCSHCQTKVLK